MKKLGIVFVLLVLIGVLSQDGDPRPPHIVLVILDSVGRGDLFTAEDKMGYSTPGFNKLVETGAVLKNYYVQMQSSPTRAALFTGRYPFKLGLQEQLVAGTTAHLPLNVPTLPELLKAAAEYQTHLVGGWGLGYASVEYTPTSRGFDTFFGYLGPEIDHINKTRGRGFDFWDEVAGNPYSYRRPAWSAKGNYSTRLYKERTTSILQDYVKSHQTPSQQSKYPLFLTIAHQAMRGPLDGHPDHGSKCKKSSKARKRYCNLMIELDEAIAELRANLVSLGLWDNTLLIVTSDSSSMVPLRGFDENENPISPGSVGSNYPCRGSKTTLFEGGVRGVALVSGGKLDPQARGKSYEGLAHAVDAPVFILSSIFKSATLSVRRALIEAMSEMDGVPLFELIGDKQSLLRFKAPRTEIPINVVSGGLDYSAIRYGRWKLIAGVSQEYRTGDGWWPASAEGPPQLPKADRHRLFFVYKLYDLYTDPLERNNMVNLTEIVREGRARLRAIVNAGDYVEPQLNLFNPLSFPFLHNGAWAPFLDDNGKPRFIDGEVDIARS